MSDKNDLTYDDIDIIETALEYFEEFYESALKSADISEADRRESRRNIRRARSVLRKIHRLFD